MLVFAQWLMPFTRWLSTLLYKPPQTVNHTILINSANSEGPVDFVQQAPDGAVTRISIGSSRAERLRLIEASPPSTTVTVKPGAIAKSRPIRPTPRSHKAR
jgi:hypothetical protein